MEGEEAQPWEGCVSRALSGGGHNQRHPAAAVSNEMKRRVSYVRIYSKGLVKSLADRRHGLSIRCFPCSSMRLYRVGCSLSRDTERSGGGPDDASSRVFIALHSHGIFFLKLLGPFSAPPTLCYAPDKPTQHVGERCLAAAGSWAGWGSHGLVTSSYSLRSREPSRSFVPMSWRGIHVKRSPAADLWGGYPAILESVSGNQG
jgi:hypothetical protein